MQAFFTIIFSVRYGNYLGEEGGRYLFGNENVQCLLLLLLGLTISPVQKKNEKAVAKIGLSMTH